jgi:outer membrane protein
VAFVLESVPQLRQSTSMRAARPKPPQIWPFVVFVASALGVPEARAEPRVIRLEEAERTALEHQPTVLQSRAQSEAAAGRYEQARSGYLPQITGIAQYQRVHGTTLRPTVGISVPTVATSTTGITYDVFQFGLSATQLIWDFGQTIDRMRAATATRESFESSERTARFQAILRVRQVYFQAHAQRALVRVGEETVKNQERHLAQIQGYVAQGMRPDIDLAQARTDLANSRVTLINAQTGYGTAKAQLNQVMGVPLGTDYHVEAEAIPPVPGEDGPPEALVAEAIKARPEIAALERQRRAAELTVTAIQGAYGPTLSALGGISEAGRSLDALGTNWNVGVNLTWPLFQGGLTRGQVREARANVEVVRATASQLELEVRLQVEQARLATSAAKVVISAAHDALENARERLRLAEGRYENGVGSIIELGDAELGMASAGAQLVQAEYNLASARAGLLSALGK